MSSIETKNTNIFIADPFIYMVNFLKGGCDSRYAVNLTDESAECSLNNTSSIHEFATDFDDKTKGYHWKNLFLPHDTEIRMQFKGVYSYAKVEENELVYRCRAISPSTLAETIAGNSRNAWRDLWIKRPTDREWKLAADCRRHEQTIACLEFQRISEF